MSHYHSKEEVIALIKAGKRAVDGIESRGGEWLGKVRNWIQWNARKKD